MRVFIRLLVLFVLCGVAAFGSSDRGSSDRGARVGRNGTTPAGKDTALVQTTAPGRAMAAEATRLDMPTFVAVAPRDLGAAISVAIPWHCRGTGSLRVLGTRGDCGCAHIEALPKRMQSGDHGVLRVRLSGTSRPGPQRVTARVYTDQPAPRDRITIRLRAWVGDFLCVRPDALLLGDVDVGFVARRTLELWQQVPASVAVELVGVDGDVDVRSAPQLGSATILALAVRVRPPAGPLEAYVRVVAGPHVLRVPIRGRVFVPPRDAAPPTRAAASEEVPASGSATPVRR